MTKCPHNKECYSGYAGERAWVCQYATQIIVNYKKYSCHNGEHGFDLGMALDSFSTKLVSCSLLNKKVRVS